MEDAFRTVTWAPGRHLNRDRHSGAKRRKCRQGRSYGGKENWSTHVMG